MPFQKVEGKPSIILKQLNSQRDECEWQWDLALKNSLRGRMDARRFEHRLSLISILIQSTGGKTFNIFADCSAERSVPDSMKRVHEFQRSRALRGCERKPRAETSPTLDNSNTTFWIKFSKKLPARSSLRFCRVARSENRAHNWIKQDKP